nr:hypothetical protein GCM10020092_084020 [Actinoplanes digitatis]
MLADYVRVLGPDHPDTLSARHNLAGLRGDAGDAVGAVAALELLLADCLRVFGPDHPDTRTCRGSLARRQADAGSDRPRRTAESVHYDPRMALLYRAELKPSKLELVAAWLPGRPWFEGPATAAIERVAAYRFDDPAGEVGIETLLVRFGDGPIHQVPLTYRGAPLDDGGDWLVGTMEHSVLGRRWVYDALGDPVYLAALAGAFADEPQAEEFIEVDGELELRAPSMAITGSGAVPEGRAATVVRRLGDDATAAGATLTGTWDGRTAPTLLAYAE